MVPTVLRNFLSVDEHATEQFFNLGLRRVIKVRVREDELTYAASVLEYYSMISCGLEGNPLACPRNLSDVFETFLFDRLPVLEDDWPAEPGEVAGGQIMFMLGFFGTQMSMRHNRRWYLWAGAGALADASMSLKKEDPVKSKLLRRMAKNFPFWTAQIAQLQQSLVNYPQQFWAPQDVRVQ